MNKIVVIIVLVISALYESDTSSVSENMNNCNTTFNLLEKYESNIDSLLDSVSIDDGIGGDGSGRETNIGIGFAFHGCGNYGGINIEEEESYKYLSFEGAKVGGRSTINIARIIYQSTSSLEYAYTHRLENIQGLKGTQTVKWMIDEFGKVTLCEVVNSTLYDLHLETVMINKIKRWSFGRINKPGDTTEVIYPFVFDNE